MIGTALEVFCNAIAAEGTLTRADLRDLRDTCLPEGVTNRDAADLLLALDRTVVSVPEFGDYLVAEIVDYVVWTERPTGIVTGELGAWLATTLAGRTGPTQSAARIAREVVREADSTEEALIAFALEANGWAQRPHSGQPSVQPCTLARAA